MRIGIITFHASHNYGSMLQAYALQTYLMSEGHDVKIINLRTAAQKALYEYPSLLVSPTRKKVMDAIMCPRLFFHNRKKWHLFESFMKEYMFLTEEFSCREELEQYIGSDPFDVLIAGGDQIWNQKCKDFDISYLLPFNTAARKVSYCPSMGRQTTVMGQEPYIGRIKDNLCCFDVLSTREPDSSEFLGHLFNRDVAVVADPTILLDKSYFDKLSSGVKVQKEPYMLYYSPAHLKAEMAFEAAKNFAKSRGLKLVSTTARPGQKDVECQNACGPIEFLSLLRNADFVCGQSYHLVVFSLLYHKEFAALNGDLDPRMKNLLLEVNLPGRGINLSMPDFSRMEEIDNDLVDAVLASSRKESRGFLAEALK